MRNYKIFIYIFLVSCNVAAFAQEAINYSPKLLAREITALGLEGNSLEELSVTSGQAQKIGNGKYFVTENKNSKYYAYVGRVNTCRAGGCRPDNANTGNNDSEYFDYFILFDKNGTVRKVRIYNYRATHGAEITSNGWLNQFVGYDGTSGLFGTKKIDAISGATISVSSITYDIESKTRLLQTILSQWKLASSKIKE